jgi:hypothetical protein
MVELVAQLLLAFSHSYLQQGDLLLSFQSLGLDMLRP